MFSKVLVATDREDGLDRLTQCLQSLHQGGITHITFVHSLDWEGDGIGPPGDMAPAIEEARRTLVEACTPIPEGLSMDVLVQVGKPSEVIKAAIKQFEPDVLLIGMAIRNLLVEKIFGSTTMELLPHVDVPVMIVRPQLIATLTLEELQLRCRHLFRTILLPCEFNKTSQQLATSIVEHMQNHSPHQVHTVLMVYVLDPSTRRNQTQPLDHLRQDYTQKLEDLKQTFMQAAPNVQFFTEVRLGSPVKEILGAAGEGDATAIATASRHAVNFWEWSVGSTTGELLRKSWHSVLFFPFHRREE